MTLIRLSGLLVSFASFVSCGPQGVDLYVAPSNSNGGDGPSRYCAWTGQRENLTVLIRNDGSSDGTADVKVTFLQNQRGGPWIQTISGVRVPARNGTPLADLSVPIPAQAWSPDTRFLITVTSVGATDVVPTNNQAEGTCVG